MRSSMDLVGLTAAKANFGEADVSRQRNHLHARRGAATHWTVFR